MLRTPVSVRELVGQGVDLLRAVRVRYGPLREAKQATRARLLTVQTRNLERLLTHTAQHSPFYRKRWGGSTPRATELEQLEPLTRADLVHLR